MAIEIKKTDNATFVKVDNFLLGTICESVGGFEIRKTGFSSVVPMIRSYKTEQECIDNLVGCCRRFCDKISAGTEEYLANRDIK